ncbi:CPBP family intramembrane metalloprotease [Lacibacter luteus]|uniref:CPBP family intramembrane metalloprotease n=1 Tax=Lacibacter luteus TaxID=2508719 RepID=A0A4Q1CJF4_9BACT|nr:CPBP family intramembrane glutamic endopeptidase [Lacibacter luteus]RXK60464.1 CPBP family intramembrane metalloprotease [Lacibacter luteus]
MRKLITITAADLLQPASYKKYVVCFFIIALACAVNYYSSFPLWIRNQPFLFSLCWYSLLFFFFFFAGLFIESGFRFTQNKRVQFVFTVAPVLFALKVIAPFYLLLPGNIPAAYHNAFLQPMNWAGGVVLILSLLLLVHRLLEGRSGLYGSRKTQSLRIYFLLIACMLPLLLWASLQSDFAAVYPKAAVVQKQLGTAVHPLHYFLFEVAYASDFFTIEFFFRGFLIIALAKAMGRQCILPVALFYFSIHLGKPMMEAVSSFFGGLLLGSIAFNSKSIWGGLLVHISIALLMELFGFIF